MHFPLILRVLGLLLTVYSVSLVPPIGVALWYAEPVRAFAIPLFLMLGAGLLLWFSSRRPLTELGAREGFVITVAFWVVLSLASALPFMFIYHLSLSQAVFEAVSGFTTTGATVMVGLDKLPRSILYYRQQLQFLGGLGVIVMAVAILPMLGIGGMQLYRAEAPGPMRDDKITPRLAHTAKSLVYIYVGLTAACTLAYWWAGMSVFDAIAHSFTTVSTGGFSPHDASFGFFNSPIMEGIAILFMFLGSLNFAVHYLALIKLKPILYWQDEQVRVFTWMLLLVTLVGSAVLFANGNYASFWTCLRHVGFYMVSIISSTGYATEDFTKWPPFIPILALSAAFVGGCVGGTNGGIKVMRVILLYKQAAREILRLIHPNAVLPVRIGNVPVHASVAEAVWGFVFLYMISYLVLSLLFMLITGQEPITSFSAVAACLNMVGPGMNGVAGNFAGINSAGLWLASFAMLLGRLEVFAVLVLLMPAFWFR